MCPIKGALETVINFFNASEIRYIFCNFTLTMKTTNKYRRYVKIKTGF